MYLYVIKRPHIRRMLDAEVAAVYSVEQLRITLLNWWSFLAHKIHESLNVKSLSIFLIQFRSVQFCSTSLEAFIQTIFYTAASLSSVGSSLARWFFFFSNNINASQFIIDIMGVLCLLGDAYDMLWFFHYSIPYSFFAIGCKPFIIIKIWLVYAKYHNIV